MSLCSVYASSRNPEPEQNIKLQASRGCGGLALRTLGEVFWFPRLPGESVFRKRIDDPKAT